MFFGLFKKSLKPIDEILESYSTLTKVLETGKKEKTHINKFHSLCEKILKYVLSDNKQSSDTEKDEIIEFLISNKIFDFITNFGIKSEITFEILLKFKHRLIKETKSKKIFLRKELIENYKLILTSLKKYLIHTDEEKIKYETKIASSNFISELCKKFFSYPTILIEMTEMLDKSSEEILIFSIILNIFKTDQLLTEYENKKLIRRAIIICLSFENFAKSNYIEKGSLFCEIVSEKLCAYFQMLPESFDISEELDDTTIEVAPNMKRTFPVMLNTYLEFRDFVYFYNKMCNTIRSFTLKEKMKISLFNKFLIENLQDKLLSKNLKIFRTNLQYFVFILKTIKHIEFVMLLFNFVFGFNDRTSRVDYTNKTISELIKNEDVQLLQLGTNNKVRVESEGNPNVNSKSLSELNVFDDYTYIKHDHIAIELNIYNNMDNSREHINLIVIVMFEVFFEKCPYILTHKLVLPFAEICLKQMEDPNRFLSNFKVYPESDLSYFFYLIATLNEKNVFDVSDYVDNLEFNMYRSYLHYINNDIDFYYYYLNQREDQEKFELEYASDENFGDDEEILENSLTNAVQLKSRNIELSKSNFKNDLRSTQSKVPIKFNFNYFSLNTKQKITLKNKLFEELTDIEEEYENINISFMKKVIEKFTNFMNNTARENLFITNLILTILTVPCFEFDPVLVMCQSLLLDEDPKSNFSIFNLSKYNTQEIENIIKNSPNRLLFIKIRNNEKLNDDKKNFKKLPKNLQESYKNDLDLLDNIIIFTEFLKEFVSIILHKVQFENMVEEFYGLYSKMLDDYNHINETTNVRENNREITKEIFIDSIRDENLTEEE